MAHHLTMRLADDRPIALTVEARRVAAAALNRVGKGFGLLAFAIADTHLHVLVVAKRIPAGECARRIEISLQQVVRPGTRFLPARIHLVRSQWHLQHAFSYVHEQLKRHHLPIDREHDGTSLPDLLGLRLIGSEVPRLASALMPRIEIARLQGLLGDLLNPPAELSLEVLADAAAATFALPELKGPTHRAALARSGAIQVAVGFSPSMVADALQIAASSMREARSRPVDPAVKRAIELQWRIRTNVRRGILPAASMDPLPGPVQANPSTEE